MPGIYEYASKKRKKTLCICWNVCYHLMKINCSHYLFIHESHIQFSPLLISDMPVGNLLLSSLLTCVENGRTLISMFRHLRLIVFGTTRLFSSLQACFFFVQKNVLLGNVSAERNEGHVTRNLSCIERMQRSISSSSSRSRGRLCCIQPSVNTCSK